MEKILTSFFSPHRKSSFVQYYLYNAKTQQRAPQVKDSMIIERRWWNQEGRLQFWYGNMLLSIYKPPLKSQHGGGQKPDSKTGDFALLIIHTDIKYRQWKQNGTRTISGGAGLTLEAERRSEPRAVVKAPALLNLGGTGALCASVSHRRAPVVHWWRLPILDALTSGARHPHPLLETQLLAEISDEE